MRLRHGLGLAALVLLGVSRVGHAHIPLVAELELDVSSPEISHAIYGTLEGRDDEVFVFRLRFEEPFALPFELLVPRRGALEDHRPVYAVVGPGLPEPTEEERALLPRPVPDGMGVFVERNDRPERLVIFESFTRRAFWTSGPVALALDAGDNEIWVFSPEGTAGDFVMGFGVEEDFGDVGCGGIVGDWSEYAY